MRRAPTILFILFASFALLVHSPLQADVRPHALFSDGAVLQQGMQVPVWGTADDGEAVTVRFRDQEVRTTARDGRWQVELASLAAGGPDDLTIRGADSEVTVRDVYVGEVWICSGQSNMQWPLEKTENGEAAIEQSAHPKIRLFTVPRRPAAEPQQDVDGAWQPCGPETTRSFSAVAYYFGRHLVEQLDVPIGLINTSYGGTPAEAWTSREKLLADPRLATLIEDPLPVNSDARRPVGLFNAMIHPLLPYAIRGAIWYQGESNAGRAVQYQTLLPAMIEDWRERWGQGDFPFLIVQLAPFHPIQEEPGDSTWAELREAQRLTTLNVPNTAQAVITDLGDEHDIHPQKKKPVGDRLALLARKLAYGEDDLVYQGPTYAGHEQSGDRLIVRFENVGSGLTTQGEQPSGFTLAGEDGKFYRADAKIEGTDTVVLSSPQVKRPVAARFGWADYPVVDLYNAEGLPASPFRTDDFPLTTGP